MATTTTKVVITAEDKTAAAFNSVHKHLTGLQTAVAGFKRSITGGIINSYLLMQGVRELERLGRAVYNDTVSWQSWQYSLQAGGLSAKEVNDQLKFLTDSAMTLGLNIKDMGTSFSRFILTGKASGMQLGQLDKDFYAISGAMRIFHLTGQQATRSWLAINEVMSMGHLQSRQFTQQLGRDWAGIGPLLERNFGKGADAMVKFIHAMEKGEITGQQFIDMFPKLMATPAMKGALVGAVTSIQSAMGRLQTTIFSLFNEAQNTDALSGMTDALNTLAKTLNDPSIKEGFDSLVTGIIKLMTWVTKAVAGFGELGDAIGEGLGRAATGIDLSGTSMSILQDQIKKTTQEYNMYLDALRAGDTVDYVGMSTEAATKKVLALRDELALLQKGLIGMQSGKAGIMGTAAITSSGTTTASAKASDPFQSSMATMNDYALGAEERLIQVKTVALEMVPPFTNLATEAAKFKLAMSQIPSLKPIKTDIQEIDQYGIAAARSIQSEFAKFFTNTHEGLRGLADGFARTMESVAANILAADLAKKLFGNLAPGNSNSGGSGWIGTAFSAVASYFGGAHAAGGTAPANKVSLVGEAGPELFMPHTSGTIIPNNALRSMGGNSHTVNIDARGAGPDEVAKLLAMRQQIMAEMRGQTEYRLNRGGWMHA